MEIKDKVIQHISKARLKEAILLLEKLTINESEEFYNEIIQQKHRFLSLERKRHGHLLPNMELEIEQNRISSNILKILDGIEKGKTRRKPIKGNLSKVKQFISEDNLADALEVLQNIVKKEKDYQDDIIILSSSLNRLERENRNGTISTETYEISKSKITLRILTILESIKEIELERKSTKIDLDKILNTIKKSYLGIFTAIVSIIVALFINVIPVVQNVAFDFEIIKFIGASLFGLLVLVVFVQIIVDKRRKQKADEILLKNNLEDFYIRAIENSRFNPLTKSK